MKVDSNLIYAAALVAMKWEEYKIIVANLCSSEWKRRGILEHMMSKYINTDTPIVSRMQNLDKDNQIILVKALEKLVGLPVDIVEY